jgi:hypothetical protein
LIVTVLIPENQALRWYNRTHTYPTIYGASFKIKKFALALGLFLASIAVFGANFFVTDTKVISTAETSLVVLRFPANDNMYLRVQDIQVQADKACTFIVKKNAIAALAGSTTLPIVYNDLSVSLTGLTKATTAPAGTMA